MDEFRALQPAQFIHPDSLHLFQEHMDTVKAGRTFRARAVDVRKDGSLMPVDVLGTSFTYRGQPHSLAVVRDVTEQVRAYELLEQRVAERTHELSGLLDISRNVASTLELGPLLELVLDQLKTLVDYDGASLLTLQGDELVVLCYRGPIPQQQALQGRFSLERSQLDQEIIRRQEPIIIDDIRADTPLARAFREAAGPYYDEFFGYIRSWMGIPLISKQSPLGLLTLDHNRPNFYTEPHARLALAFAHQAAVAMENARLFKATPRRAEQFRVIGELGYRITSILAVDELLGQTVRLIRETFGYYHIHIGLLDDGRVLFRREAGCWRDEGGCTRCEAPDLRVGPGSLSGLVAESGEPILVPDVSRDPRVLPLVPDPTGSELGLPLKVKGRVIGVLDLESDQRNAFDIASRRRRCTMSSSTPGPHAWSCGCRPRPAACC